MSWKPEVLAVGDDKWVTNGLRFATKEEAEAYALDLSLHYTMVRDTRAVEVDDPVNYTYHDHQLRAVEGITVRATRMLDHDENQLELPFGRVIGRDLAAGRDNDDRLGLRQRHTWEHAGKVRLGAGRVRWSLPRWVVPVEGNVT
jgi:hypothetical protein